MPMNFKKWVKAVLKHWYGYVGGAFVAVFLFLFQELGGFHLRLVHFISLLGIGLAYSMFAAWSDEHQAKERAEKAVYEGRPLFVLDVTQQPGWGSRLNDGRAIFALRNCGGRTARWIRLADQQDYKKYHTLSFAEVPSLGAGETQPLTHTVDQHGMHPGMLYDFLTNGNAPDAALVWWDIEVHFRDTDEVNKKEMVRLCFDVQAKHLYATGVPYTAKSVTQP